MSGVGRLQRHHDQSHISRFYFRTLVLSLFGVLLAWILPTDTGSSVVPPGGGGGASASTTMDISSSSSSSYWTFPARSEGSSSSTTTTTTTTTTTQGAAAPQQSNNINNNSSKERGKWIGDQWDASTLYAVYKGIESEYHEKAFAAPKSEWKVLLQKDNVEVSMMEIPSDPTCPYVRMTAIIPTPIEDCWEFLQLAHWDENIPLIDPFYEGVSLHGTFYHRAGSTHMILARKRTKRILAFGKRDFVFLSVADTKPLPDGTKVSGTVSVHTPQIPRQAGYTRAYQDSIAFYKPLENNSKTLLTIVFRMDLNDSSPAEAGSSGGGGGGWLPMWLYVKTIGTTGNRSVHTLRTVLVEAHERKRVLALEQAARDASTTKEKHSKPRSWTKWKKKVVPLDKSDLPEPEDTLHTHRRIPRWVMPWRRSDRHEKMD